MTTNASRSVEPALESLTPERVQGASLAELEQLAEDIRAFLIENVARTGGHIGANLGTVELAIALHRVFSSPGDRIVWDTGHQGYVHKIVTGRAGLFPTLNTYGGMSRFVTRTESVHDPIEASHGGTSISVALGMALARRIEGSKHWAVAVIGDGSLCEGLALEALNHAAVERGVRLLIVLNDNGYAISPGFGALHEYLQTRGIGDERPETLFTSLGYRYLGPVDGHDIGALVAAFQEATTDDGDRVALVHAKTVKGRGLALSDSHPYRMHFSMPFDTETGAAVEGFAYTGYQDVAARVIGEEMEHDARVVAITPSTLYASGLEPIFERFPDRTFDPGMEEQHAMTLTVGLALEGMKPCIVFQSTFMQRAYDQLFHDVCFADLPTLILAVRSGFAGYDNPTHHGIYDFAYLRGLPNLRILYPKDSAELERMVREAITTLQHPTMICMPYGPIPEDPDVSVFTEPASSFARPQVVLEGSDLVVLTVGHRFDAAREAAQTLRDRGVDCGLVNLRYLKPLPEEALAEILSAVPRAVSLEEAVLEGGVGSAIAALVADRRLGCDLLRIGVPCAFVEAGSNAELCRIYGLDAAGVLKRVEERWGQPPWGV
jgi:1-deoxy-D-xylulose-5-phosphate synthase